MIAYEFIADKQAPDEIFKKLPLPVSRDIIPELLFPERALRGSGIPSQGGQVKLLDDRQRRLSGGDQFIQPAARRGDPRVEQRAVKEMQLALQPAG